MTTTTATTTTTITTTTTTTMTTTGTTTTPGLGGEDVAVVVHPQHCIRKLKDRGRVPYFS